MIDDFMQDDEIRNILMKSLLLDDAYVYITGNHYHVVVISDKFEGMTKVNKHKLVFNPLMKYIAANKIHSLTINAYTLDEWKQNTKLDNH